MRIALLPSAYAPAVGGVEELTHRLATRLMAHGDDVEVWTNQHPPTLPHTEVVEGIRVQRFALPLPSANAASLATAPARGLAAIARLRRAADAFRPDVLHVQCFSSNGVYAAALSALNRTPLVVSLQGETVMDDNDIYERSTLLRTALRLALKRASVVTGCSRFVLADAEGRFGLRPGDGHVVPNGVELEEGGDPAPVAVPSERFVFGVGRVVEKKGFDLLLEAFARVAADRPDLSLVIGGEGAARDDLAVRAAQLGVADRVGLPGVLSRAQVAWAMRNAAVFVLPSRVEPFGIVVVEALRAGAPAVVSSRGGAAEIVRHGHDGFVVDPLDTDALAGAIARVLDDGTLRARLADAGPRRAREFAWSEIAELYRAIYRTALSGRGSSRAA